MGVDFITCSNPKCGYNFPDCGDWNYCNYCEVMFCADCGKLQYNEDTGESISCMLCRGEEISNNDLIKFLLSKCGMTRQSAIKEFNKENKK